MIEIIVSFCVWIYGMWFFRREEGVAFEHLSALIETVFLRCLDPSDNTSQDVLVQTLTNYLIYGGYALLLYTAFALWVGLTLAMELLNDFRPTTAQFVLSFLSISIGYLAEQAVYVATIVIYWIICRLHIRYLDGVRDRMNKRSISLSRAIREITSIKKLVNETNVGWGVPVSIMAFSSALQVFYILIRLVEVRKQKKKKKNDIKI